MGNPAGQFSARKGHTVMEDKDTKSRPVSTELPLRDAVAIAGKFASKAGVIPVLSCALIMPDGMIAATDLTRRVSIRTDARIAAPICVDAANLAKALGRNGSFRLEIDGRNLVIKRGRSKSVVAGLPPDDFPLAPAMSDETTSLTVPAKAWMDALGCAHIFVSKDPSKPYISGGHVEIGERVEIVSTDGHRLFWADLGNAEDLGMSGPHFRGDIPAETLAVVSGCFPDSAELNVSFDAKSLRVSGGAVSISSQLLQDSYPDWRRIVMTEDYSLEFKVSAPDMGSAVRDVSWACGATAEKGIRATRISVDDGAAIISSVDSADGVTEAQSEIPVYDEAGPKSREPFSFIANSRYLADIFGVYGTGSAVIRCISPQNPFTIVGVDEPGKICILMPIRR